MPLNIRLAGTRPLAGLLRRLVALAGLAAVAASAGAQGGTIKILTGFAAGGGGDITARALAEALQARLGTPVIVENRTGAAGALAAQALKAAPADGTVFMLTSEQLYILPTTLKSAGFDPARDFTLVAGVNTYDLCMAVSTSRSTARNLAEYLQAASRDPSLATFAVPGAGSLPQFFGYVIGQQAKVALTAVPYRGAAPLVTDLSAGHVAAAISPCRDMAEQARAGKLRLIATVQRLGWAAEVQTFADAGFSMITPSWLGLFAPAGLPAARQQAMQDAVREVLLDPAFRDRMSQAGFVPRYVPGKELAAQAQEAGQYWSARIRESGFVAQ